MKKKWRGIKTTQVHKNENIPVTIVNRLGQKSLSMPRIDDKKRWAGYPSIAGIARGVAQLVPRQRVVYAEPFAGTAKVYQELTKLNKDNSIFMQGVLNDKSDFINGWLKKEFNKGTVITKRDFVNFMKTWDGKDTFFLIDMPWYRSYYDQVFSCFDRDSVQDYDNEVIEQCKKLKGKFIITSRKENERMLNSGFNNYLIKSIYVLCGKYPRVLLTTNLKLKKLKQI